MCVYIHLETHKNMITESQPSSRNLFLTEKTQRSLILSNHLNNHKSPQKLEQLLSLQKWEEIIKGAFDELSGKESTITELVKPSWMFGGSGTDKPANLRGDFSFRQTVPHFFWLCKNQKSKKVCLSLVKVKLAAWLWASKCHFYERAGHWG